MQSLLCLAAIGSKRQLLHCLYLDIVAVSVEVFADMAMVVVDAAEAPDVAVAVEDPRRTMILWPLETPCDMWV